VGLRALEEGGVGVVPVGRKKTDTLICFRKSKTLSIALALAVGDQTLTAISSSDSTKFQIVRREWPVINLSHVGYLELWGIIYKVVASRQGKKHRGRAVPYDLHILLECTLGPWAGYQAQVYEGATFREVRGKA